MVENKRGGRGLEIGGADKRPLVVRRVRSDGWTRKRCELFLDTLAATCNVRLSAETAGKDVSTAYRLRKRDAGFLRAWEDALAIGYEQLETALAAHALSIAKSIEVARPEEGAEGARLSHADVQSALAILKRRDDLASKGARRTGKRRPTSEEVNQELTERLDKLAKRLAYL